jgi:hypothetical protein
MTRTTEKTIYRELCVTLEEKPGVGIYEVTKGFRLPVRKGPHVALKAGDLCELSRETAESEFYLGRVIPHDPALPEIGTYIVIRPFRTIVDGLWIDLKRDEKLELELGEALPLLRTQKIRLEGLNESAS